MTRCNPSAAWIIRDCLVWAYAQGFPKGRANLKPAWEPIVMARKPGPLRVPIETIRAILGHSKAEMTRHYARSEDAAMREAMEKLGRAVNG